ncbi:MAG: hypothetical protein GY821_09830 [Gammaproteobacteria bacterium]|nr:hypothetical protein [Gammaproteobacteria bacterium]
MGPSPPERRCQRIQNAPPAVFLFTGGRQWRFPMRRRRTFAPAAPLLWTKPHTGHAGRKGISNSQSNNGK